LTKRRPCSSVGSFENLGGGDNSDILSLPASVFYFCTSPPPPTTALPKNLASSFLCANFIIFHHTQLINFTFMKPVIKKGDKKMHFPKNEMHSILGAQFFLMKKSIFQF
jgi:hypothetical protein